VTVRVYVPGGVPGLWITVLPPSPPHAVHTSVSSNRLTSANEGADFKPTLRRWRFIEHAIAPTAIRTVRTNTKLTPAAPKSSQICRGTPFCLLLLSASDIPNAGGRIRGARGEVAVAAVVVTDTVVVAALDPLSVTDSGLTVHVDFEGAPLHANLTVPARLIKTIALGSSAVTTVQSLASAEVFNPMSGTFALTADMTTARSAHTATLLANGSVLVVGGFDANGNALATAELFQ
jgi:hypothetical protein